MVFTQEDVLDHDTVRARVEQIVRENLQFRQAFRQINAPSDAGDSFSIPVPTDMLGLPESLEELEEYPHDEGGYEKVAIDRQKIGQVVPITDEAEMDSIFDVVSYHVDRMARKMQEKLNSEAYEVLSNNVNATTAGDNNGTLEYADAVSGLRTSRSDGYNPDLLIIEAQGEEELLTDPNFTHATDAGDNVIRNGVIARVAGMDVVVSNTGDMTNSNAFVVDTDYYGYEASWEGGIQTDRFREEMSDTDFLKIRAFRGWAATDASAAVLVQG